MSRRTNHGAPNSRGQLEAVPIQRAGGRSAFCCADSVREVQAAPPMVNGREA